jgi:hypothetical protein
VENFNILEKLRIYLLKDTEILARESDPLEKRGISLKRKYEECEEAASGEIRSSKKWQRNQ